MDEFIESITHHSLYYAVPPAMLPLPRNSHNIAQPTQIPDSQMVAQFGATSSYAHPTLTHTTYGSTWLAHVYSAQMDGFIAPPAPPVYYIP